MIILLCGPAVLTIRVVSVAAVCDIPKQAFPSGAFVTPPPLAPHILHSLVGDLPYVTLPLPYLVFTLTGSLIA